MTPAETLVALASSPQGAKKHSGWPFVFLMRLGASLLFFLPMVALAMGTPPKKPAAAVPGTPGVMLRDDALRAEPRAAAPSLAQLGKGSSVRVLAGEGGWTQVYAAGKTGWVRILSVKSDLSSMPDLGALAEVGKRPADAGKVVAVAGSRGLDEGELKAARYAPDELILLDALAVSRAEAEQFARMAGLTRRDIANLPQPE